MILGKAIVFLLTLSGGAALQGNPFPVDDALDDNLNVGWDVSDTGKFVRGFDCFSLRYFAINSPFMLLLFA